MTSEHSDESMCVCLCAFACECVFAGLACAYVFPNGSSAQETRLGISLLPNLHFGTCKRLSPDNVAMIMDYYGYVGRTDGGWCVFVWAGVAG